MVKLNILITLELNRKPSEHESNLIVKHIADVLDVGDTGLYDNGYIWSQKFSCDSPLIINHHFVEIKK